MDYSCNICNKNYTSYKSLWYHKYKYHNKNVTNNDDIVTNNVTKITTNLNCKFCNKLLASRQSKNRHENHYCKEKNKINIINKIENQDDKIEILIETVNKLKKENELIKKNNINNTQNNNNTNNGIINNNHIHINALGNEDFMKKLSDKEKFNLLTSPLFEELPIVELVNKIYTDDKLKDDRNTKITNLQSSNCLAYNNNTKKFEAVDKNKHIDKIIKCRKDDFTKLYNDRNINRKIKPQHKLIIADYMDTLENDDVKKVCKKHKKEIIYIIYNATKNLKEKLDEADALELLESSEEEKNLVV